MTARLATYLTLATAALLAALVHPAWARETGPADPAGPRAAAAPERFAAPPAAGELPDSGRPADCPRAAITEVDLRGPAAVDEIRVVVDERDRTGSAEIRVEAGRFDRVVRVLGGASRRLEFRPALVGEAFRVSLGPVLEARRGACVDRVELLHRGSRVAVVPL